MRRVELIAAGREADVFDLGDGRVLRRCRDPRTDCEPSAALMRWVHDEGFPVPRVHSVAGPDMVLERLDGATMLESLATGTTSAADGGRMLAALQSRLHALPPPQPSPEHDVVRHLDLHPGNVILTADGPVVIDWRNSDVGPAAVDTALTGLILAEVVCGDGPYAAPARLVLDAFLDAVGAIRRPHVEAARIHRAHDPALTAAEKALLATAADLVARRV